MKYEDDKELNSSARGKAVCFTECAGGMDIINT